MKILFYLQSLVAGGAQRVVAVLANHWVANGHEVIIVTLEDPASDFYALDTRVRRMRLQHGSTPGNGGIVATFRRIRALRKLIRAKQPDVTISMMDTANVVLALAGLGLARGILVGSERIYPPLSGIPRHWEILRRLTYRYLDVVVAQTSKSAAWLGAHTRANNIWTIPNPIVLPLDRHAPVAELKVSPAVRVLLAIGRLVPQKNMVALIDAFAKIASDVDSWILVIVGDGPERTRIENRIAELKLERRITLVGRAGNAGDWYGRADLFAMASKFEGFPNTLLEALSHGIASVAFDCDSGPSDLIRHGIDGYLVPLEQVDALSESLRKLMLDDELRTRFAKRASEARERYAVSRIASEWEAAFDSAQAKRTAKTKE